MVRGDSFLQKIGVLSLTLMFALSLGTPTSVFADNVRLEVARICRKEKQSQGGMKESQCKAAKDNLNGKNANTANAAVNSGIAVVCGAACANWSQAAYCKYANLVGSAASSFIQKDFMSSLTPLATNAATNAAKKTVQQEGTEQLAQTKDLAPCIQAATAADKSVKNFNHASQNGNDINKLGDQAARLDSGTDAAGAPLPGFQETSTGSKGITQSAAMAAEIPGENTLCRAENLKTASGALACAGSMNPNLPPEVRSGQFLSDLEKVTGKPADQFFADFQNPGTSIMNALGPKMTAENQQLMAQGLLAMSQDTKFHGTTGTQVVGRGATNSDLPVDHFDPMASMQEVLAQLAGGKGEESAQNPGSLEMKAGGAIARAPAFISPEDKTVSIFDRVKWRYGAVQQRGRVGE